jgi:hypothetical protein
MISVSINGQLPGQPFDLLPIRRRSVTRQCCQERGEVFRMGDLPSDSRSEFRSVSTACFGASCATEPKVRSTVWSGRLISLTNGGKQFPGRA